MTHLVCSLFKHFQTARHREYQTVKTCRLPFVSTSMPRISSCYLRTSKEPTPTFIVHVPLLYCVDAQYGGFSGEHIEFSGYCLSLGKSLEFPSNIAWRSLLGAAFLFLAVFLPTCWEIESYVRCVNAHLCSVTRYL